MLPMSKSSSVIDDSDMSDDNVWRNSSPNLELDFYDDEEEGEAMDLLDGLLNNGNEKRKADDSRVHSIIRVYPNGKSEEKKIRLASATTADERELIGYLGGSQSRSANKSSNDVVSSQSSGDGDKCMSKSAIAARENRKKKKQHMNFLEKTLETLKTENEDLKSENTTLQSSVEQLVTEVNYLKSVIAHQSTLARLIGNIQNTPGVKFFTSITTSSDSDNSGNKENIGTAKQDNVKKQSSKDNRKRKAEDTPSVETRRMSTRSADKIIKVTNTSKENPQKSMNNVEEMNMPTSCATETQGPSTSKGGSAAGVCLHVSSGSVSLEFCASCASSAAYAKSASYDHSYGKTGES